MDKKKRPWLIKTLNKLPNNGDWLYVTAAPCKPQKDLTDDFNNPDLVLNNLSTTNNDVLKFIYERAKNYEQTIIHSSDHVRTKAANLLSTASFASAILLGITASSLVILPKLNLWLRVLELILLILLVSHLLRALSLAIKSITQEKTVGSQPKEILFANEDITKVYKEAISQTIAYSIQTQTLQREKANILILGQHAFRFGIIYFSIILLLNTFLSTFIIKGTDSTTKINSLQHKIISSTNKQGNGIIQAINKLSNEVDKLRETNKELSSKLDLIIYKSNTTDNNKNR